MASEVSCVQRKYNYSSYWMVLHGPLERETRPVRQETTDAQMTRCENCRHSVLLFLDALLFSVLCCSFLFTAVLFISICNECFYCFSIIITCQFNRKSHMVLLLKCNVKAKVLYQILSPGESHRHDGPGTHRRREQTEHWSPVPPTLLSAASECLTQTQRQA